MQKRLGRGANPFVPGFGESPPYLAGRDQILDSFRLAFECGPSHRYSSGLLVGARGEGKTVLLTELEAEARRLGWFAISEHASVDSSGASVIDRLIYKFDDACDRRAKRSRKEPRRRRSRRQVKSVGVAAIGHVTFEDEQELTPSPSLEAAMLRVGELCARSKKCAGVLFTIDEIQNIDLLAARTLGHAFQLASRRKRLPLAVIGAGLPEMLHTILEDPGATFLRRLDRWSVDPLGDADSERALSVVFDDRGLQIEPNALDVVIKKSAGSPYFLQLVGWHAWDDMHSGSTSKGTVTRQILESACEQADETFKENVLAPIWRDLSDVEKRFMVAMSVDSEMTKTRDVARRLGKSSQYVNVYRRRLIDKRVISSPQHGSIQSTHPGLLEMAANSIIGGE